MNIKTKNYLSPTMLAYSIEMEEGIAAGSGEATPGTPTIIEEDGGDETIWDVDGF